jgi:hypothetical protein
LAATVGLALLLAFMAVVILQGGLARAQTHNTAGIIRELRARGYGFGKL